MSQFLAHWGFEIAGFCGLRAQNLAISFLRFPFLAKHDSVGASEGTMRPKQHKTTGSNDRFRARLDQIINLKHELAQLAGQIDWDFIDGEIARSTARRAGPGSRHGSRSGCCCSNTFTGCPT
jgi:hypothetical protein